MKRNIIFSLLLVTGLTAIKAQDTLSSQLKRSIVKRYSSILPLLSAAGEFGSGSSSFIDGTLGLRIGQGINIKKINIGIDVSHEVYYQKGSNNTFISYLRAYGEYQFYQNKKATFLVGVRPYGFRFEYTPTDWYQFLNDPIDGKQHTHFIGGVSLYTSADIRIREKCHLVFGLGLDKKFSTKSGLLPRNLPMIFMLDFRAPFPKFMMKKNSKVQNYY